MANIVPYDAGENQGSIREKLNEVISYVNNPSLTEIMLGTATAAQNIHGAKGTVTGVDWDTTVLETDYLTLAGSTITAVLDAVVFVSFSVGLIDVGVNNRTTYVLRVTHNSYTYYVDDTYVRDDNNTYDSGLMAGQLQLFLQAGDTLDVEVEVLDVQTTAGTVPPSTTYSQIKIDRVTTP